MYISKSHYHFDSLLLPNLSAAYIWMLTKTISIYSHLTVTALRFCYKTSVDINQHLASHGKDSNSRVLHLALRPHRRRRAPQTQTSLLRSGRRIFGLNLPPGPWPLPVIGNMHCLLGALPHHGMRRLAQRYDPIMLLRLSHVRTMVVSSPEAARDVLKTHDAILADRPLYVTMNIFIYGGKGITC